MTVIWKEIMSDTEMELQSEELPVHSSGREQEIKFQTLSQYFPDKRYIRDEEEWEKSVQNRQCVAGERDVLNTGWNWKIIKSNKNSCIDMRLKEIRRDYFFLYKDKCKNLWSWSVTCMLWLLLILQICCYQCTVATGQAICIHHCFYKCASSSSSGELRGLFAQYLV